MTLLLIVTMILMIIATIETTGPLSAGRTRVILPVWHFISTKYTRHLPLDRYSGFRLEIGGPRELSTASLPAAAACAGPSNRKVRRSEGGDDTVGNPH